jgi:glucosamine--fructose-6-phosphate aminotransferase (isomerizing)
MSDYQTAEITSGMVKVYKDGKRITPKSVNIVESIKGSNLGSFETYMIKEIYEQPNVALEALKRNEYLLDQDIKINGDIILTACGTSYNACLMAQLFFEKLGISSEVLLASELRYRPVKLNDKTIIAVSQSGETADTMAVINEASCRGSKVISVVNREHCSMDRYSDVSVYTHAGPEISVASTKSFIAQVITLYMLGMSIGNNNFAYKELLKLPRMISGVLNNERDVEKIAESTYLNNSAFFLGRLFGAPVAEEGALKLKEISYMHAEAYAAGEMKHGPIALISKDVPVMVLADNSCVYEKVISNAQEMKSRGALLIGVSHKKDRVFDYVLEIEECEDYISPIIASVYWQLLAYYIAKLRGCNIDKPRNLAKSVTVE